MQTPEEVARTALLPPLDDPDRPDTSCTIDASEWYAYALRHAERLIAARDEAIRADERAKVLAGFEVERADRMVARRVPCDCPGDWQHHGRFVGDDGPETHATFDVVPSRRLVGPWEPTEEDA